MNVFAILTFILCTPTFIVALPQNYNPLESCTKVKASSFRYKFNVWVLVPFKSKYKFSKQRVQLALTKSRDDAWADLSRIANWNISSIIDKSDIKLQFNDSQCDADKAPTAASDIHDVSLLEECNSTTNNTLDIDVILGMTCDYAAGRVATLGNHWKWPLLYPGTRTTGFNKKNATQCCSTMVRPGITAQDLGNFVLSLFKRFEWNTSVLLYTYSNSHGAHVSFDLSNDCGTLLRGISDAFTAEGWENDADYYEIITRSTDANLEETAKSILQDEFRKRARVSIWCIGRRAMRKVMKVAETLNMTNGEYVFIYLDMYNTNTSYYWTDDDDHLTSDTSDPSDKTSFNERHTDSSLRALTVVTIHTPTNIEYKNFSDTIKENLTKSTNGSVVESDEFVNPFISFYYDAMRLFVYGMMSLFCTGSSQFENGEDFAKLLWDIEFESLGRNVTISKEGDQKLDYAVMDMNNVSKKFELALIYYGNTGNFREVDKIDWPGSKVPLNIPVCGFENELCPEIIRPDNTTYYILGAIAAALILACIIITMLHRNYMREKRLRKMMWRVKWEEIDWSRNRTSSIGESKDSSHSVTSSNNGHLHASSRQIFAKVGRYKGNVVAVKQMKRRKVTLDRAMLVELEEMYAMDHTHICRFIGAVDETPHVSILMEYCARGSLQDFLEDDTEYEMDDVFKNSFLSDITKGMMYLHKNFFQFHGNLKSSNCLIDSRFVVKLTDFGLAKFREGARRESVDGFKCYENKLWTAPEHIRNRDANGSQKGDVYSYGIVAQEILYRKGVFYRPDDLSLQEILHHITSPSSKSGIFRPTLEDDDDVVINPKVRKLVQRCWAENPAERPGFPEIYREVKRFHREKNLVDSLLERLENYSQHLEEKVDERTTQYKTEKERADTLLYQMLPKAVADELKRGQNVLPKAFDSVTIFFSDIVGFTAISHGSKPMQVVNMLNDLYTMFDQIIDRFDVYKVETIGDAYMVVSGLPHKNGDNHAREIARMSLSLMDSVANAFKIKHMPDTQLKLRVGMHTGPVVAGVVGLKMPRYCLFGDTVNTASRMESNGKPLAIHVSPKTKKVLEGFGNFILKEREDEVFLKGLGTWKTFWLEGETDLEDPLANEKNKVTQNELKSGHSVGNIVTFETETLSGKDGLLALTLNRGIANSANSIITEPNSPLFFKSHGFKSSPGKRRRSGVVGVSEAVQIGRNIIASPKNLHKQVILEEGSENGAQRVNSSKSRNDSSKRVHFNSNEKIKPDQNFSQNSFRGVQKSGRDSGIGLGFDNTVCLEKFNSEENDIL